MPVLPLATTSVLPHRNTVSACFHLAELSISLVGSDSGRLSLSLGVIVLGQLVYLDIPADFALLLIVDVHVPELVHIGRLIW